MHRFVLRLAGAACVAAALSAPCPALAFEPTRREYGDLVALEVGGDYEEIGRQQAQLLGDDLRRVYALQLGDHERAVARGGFGAWLLDAIGIPLWASIGGFFEDSHFHEELAGMADGLGVARSDLMRALLSLGGGSTVFAATRSATADGEALVGRNVDWGDGLGARRPLVVRVRPTNGDLSYLLAGWPLSGLPTLGVNEAGFALSFNYFETDPQVGMLLPQWPHRRALQAAKTVDEGIALFLGARERGISAFMVMADAAGDLAMVECSPSRCAVFRPEGDWFGQSNHARTPEMIPYDRGRSPDSFARRTGIERATAAHVGQLTPAIAAEILRDRSFSPWPNASNVGNLFVLNAAVLHPASRTLWHSTAMQPHAPFGGYVAFTLAPGAEPPPPIAASPWLGSAAQQREAESVARARGGVAALREGRFETARDAFAAEIERRTPVLDPVRLALGLAMARFELGDLDGAAAALEPARAEDAPLDVRIPATSMRAVIADRRGRRDEAAALHREVLALAATHPEWNEFAPFEALAREGEAHSLANRSPVFHHFLLRLPF